MFQSSNKEELPAGWIIKTSKKHPDRIFYFNVDSGESCWTLQEVYEKNNNNKKNGKRKTSNEQTEYNSSDYSSVEEDYYSSVVNSNAILKKKTVLNIKKKNHSTSPNKSNTLHSVQQVLEKDKEANILSDSSDKSVILCQSFSTKKKNFKQKSNNDIQTSESEIENGNDTMSYSDVLNNFGNEGLKEKLSNLQVNFQKRSSLLETGIERNNHLYLLNKKESLKNEIEDETAEKRILKKLENISVCKQDFWRPIQDERILKEVQNARFQKNINQSRKSQDLSNFKYTPFDISKIQNSLYIVIDTNVFISNLELIKDIQDSYSHTYGKPFIVIPWTVLQELVYLENDSSKSQILKLKANEAVEFLKKNFTAENTKFLGQLFIDVEKNKERFSTECPNDEILQICLQIQDLRPIALISYDETLYDKAAMYDIKCLGKNDALENINLIKLSNHREEFLLNSLNIQFDENKELSSENTIEKGKSLLQSVLSTIVTSELEKMFGNKWKIHIDNKPPWNIEDVIKLTLKYWVIAFSQLFLKKGEIFLKDIQIYVSDTYLSAHKLQKTMLFLEKSLDFIQTINDDRFFKLKTETTNKLMDLRKECKNTINDNNYKKFKDLIGQCIDKEEEERRANYAFSCFEEIYSFTRDTCGLTAEKHGMPCSFIYNKSHPYLNIAIVSQIYKDVAASSINLLQVLTLALEKIKSAADVNANLIINVYDALVNFSPEIELDKVENITPLDVYCCIKWKKHLLHSGLHQLRELTMHFCRMASHKFT